MATEACAYLEQRFNVSGIIKDLDVLDATNWPTTAKDRNIVVEYGQAEMSRILDHFVSFYPESIRRQAENQWLQVKLHVCKKVPLSDRNFYTLWPKAKNATESWNSFFANSKSCHAFAYEYCSL